MRKSYLYLVFALLTFWSCNKKISTSNDATQLPQADSLQRASKLMPDEIIDKNATTFLLVRHAEKTKDSKDPGLTEKGHKRTRDLANVLSNIPFKAIYSTDFRRTRMTAEYTAKMRYMDGRIKIYDHRDLEGAAEEMLTNHPKQAILVSGHSNTTPRMLNILTKTDDWQSLSEDDYDNLFVVSVYENAPAKVLHFKYGEPNE